MPESHQKYQSWNKEQIITLAKRIGENCTATVRSILDLAKVEQQGYKSCLALLKLADKYGSSELEQACQKALSFNPHPDFKFVQSILKADVINPSSGEASELQEDDLSYSLIRGPEYYKRGYK